MKDQKWAMVQTAASLFEAAEMPETFDGTEYARGVVDLLTMLLGYTSEEMSVVWDLLKAEAYAQSRGVR